MVYYVTRVLKHNYRYIYPLLELTGDRLDLG